MKSLLNRGLMALLAGAAMAAPDRNAGIDGNDKSKPYTGPIPDRMESETTPTRVLVAFNVFFNDIQQFDCIMADRITGEIERYVRTNGRLQVGPGGRKLTQKLKGVVRFERKE